MTRDQFDAILAQIAVHGNAKKAIRDLELSNDEFYTMLATDAEAADAYARAKVAGCHAFADDSIDLADIPPELEEVRDKEGNLLCVKFDNAYVQWRKLRIETRKWHLSKLLPKKYGDKILVGGDPDNPIPPMVVVGPIGATGSDDGE